MLRSIENEINKHLNLCYPELIVEYCGKIIDVAVYSCIICGFE